MHAKNNRQNTDFQIVYFLIGACHTADGAYALLCDLHEDRSLAVDTIAASELRTRAKRARAEAVVNDSQSKAWERDEAAADLAELDALEPMTQRNIASARAELATIEKCMAALQPLRKFAHLPDPQAHQAAQRDEWKLELVHRAENQLMTTGAISPELLSTMRMHPQFAVELLPELRTLGTLLESKDGQSKLMDRLAGKRPQFMSLPAFQQLALSYEPPAEGTLPAP